MEAVETDLARPRVNCQTAQDQGAFSDRGAGPSKNGTKPGIDLRDSEGLDDVVVRATVQGLDHVGVVVASRDDDDRHLADRPQHRENLQTIDIRQPEVQQDDVRRVVNGGLQSGHPTVARGHGVTQVGQSPRDRGPDAAVVFDQQDGGHVRTLRPAATSCRESDTVAPW